MRVLSILRSHAIWPIAMCIGTMSTAVSQETTDDTEERFGEIEEIVVEGSLRSLPTEDVGSVFGFGKTLLETPRSASTISSDQMDRFDMRDIDELIALAPGTFTQSFFGVAGSLDVRGTSGETYFRGVRRLDNPGNYPTPIAASDRVDIVRGPASVVYGPAKMGGYLNFVPKSARASGGQYLSEPEGRLSYTTGSWRKSVVSAEVGGPGSIGGKDFGYHLYAEVENSGSYYRSSETNQTVIQASFDSDLTDKTRIAFGGMYHYFDGNQNAGWNRLTQDLIDTGTYITGSPAPLDLNGDGEIAHLEYFIGGIGFFFGDPSQVTPADLTPNMALLNPGTTILDRRNVVVADDDVLENEVTTLYFDIIHETDGGWEIKNQLFFETYNNLNENAYGFSQFHNSYVIEEKLVLSKVFESGSLTTSLQLSPSLRYTDFEHGDDFINEFFDRRDLTGPSTALDRRRLSTRSGINYSTFQVGDYLNLGLGAIADFTWESGFSVLLGLRYDSVDAESTDIDSRLGPLFGSGADNPVDDTENGISWTASVSYETEAGIIPYITASEQSTTIAGQGAEIDTGLLASGSWFDVSELLEFGVKTSFLDDTLYMALAVYTQERTDFSAQSTVTNQSNETEGVEFELRWAVNDNLLVTAGYSNIEIINLNTIENGGRFSFYGAEDLPQIDPTLYFGGQFAGTVTLSDDSQAIRAGIPENIFSFTGTYGWDNGWAVNASVVAVDSVFSGFSQAVRLPSYTLVNLGVIYEADDWSISLTGKNLTDEEYFRANFPNLFGSQIVLPELPRNYQASFTYNF